MGERVLCKHEVIGSIPFASTIYAFPRDKLRLNPGSRRSGHLKGSKRNNQRARAGHGR